MASRTVAAVLRYSDREAPTISSHREIVERNQYVWWGWWRKEFEPPTIDLLRRLQRLARREELYVALLNRKDRDPQTILARCVDVRFNDDASRTNAPDPKACPEYYRQERCAAWFKLTRLDDLGLKRYEEQFGPIPIGDPTLYDVRSSDWGQLQVVPRPSWQLRPVDAPGESILHISDLHFGESHGYAVTSPGPGHGVAQPILADVIASAMEQGNHDIGMIVASGDLISKGNPDDFDLVEAFFDRLLPALGLNRRHVVITPGNHDFRIIGPNDKPRIDYRHESAFRRFMQNFYGNRHVELERLQRFKTPAGWDLIFVALNSARLRGHESKEYGYVGRHRYEEMLNFVSEGLNGAPEFSSRQIGFAVLHHHVLPTQELSPPEPGTPVSMTADAVELCTQLQLHGFKFVLHGHQHLPCFLKYTRALTSDDGFLSTKELYVIGNGSSGARVADLTREVPYNTLGVYTPVHEGLKINFMRYLPEIRPTTLMQTLQPL